MKVCICYTVLSSVSVTLENSDNITLTEAALYDFSCFQNKQFSLDLKSFLAVTVPPAHPNGSSINLSTCLDQL